ncbi:hypothetical protein MCOR25_009816 [Pyricularia grisea]|nr:hypothetical protein MCOR25_009816 [Pyricularia grisea]
MRRARQGVRALMTFAHSVPPCSSDHLPTSFHLPALAVLGLVHPQAATTVGATLPAWYVALAPERIPPPSFPGQNPGDGLLARGSKRFFIEAAHASLNIQSTFLATETSLRSPFFLGSYPRPLRS